MLYALLTFPVSLHCQIELLGKTFSGKISGIDVTLSFPRYEKKTQKEKYSRDFLMPPPEAERWKIGEETISWGELIGYSKLGAAVDRLLILVDVSCDDVEAARTVTLAIGKWTKALFDFSKLCSRQDTGRAMVDTSEDFCKFQFVPYIDITKRTRITIMIPNGDHFLSVEQFKEAVLFASSGKELLLEYQMLLSAHAAKRDGSNRQAIVDACSAIEICAVKRISLYCKNKGLNSEQYLEKYKSLGDRLFRIKQIDKDFPIKDVGNTIVKPRNDVIHNRDAYPSDETTKKVITAVEQCLKFYHTTYY